MTSPLSSGRLGHALSNLLGHGPGGEFLGGPDSDLLLGTRRSDDLRGGSGSDVLLGFRGSDVLHGGAGLDAAWGGAGDDAFVFASGDLISSRSILNGYLGQVDTVLDFHGAGTTGSGQQDVIRLEGFGAGTTLEFAGSGGPWSLAGLGRGVQLYEVVDPTTEGADGFVLVNLANNRGNRLTAEDVVVVPDEGQGEGPRITNLTQGANDSSSDPSISADGSTVTFFSYATNLVEGQTDANGNVVDIFLFDLVTGERINVTRGGNAASYDPSLSADGSTLVFRSFASNLIPGEPVDFNDNNGDIFLYDVASGETIQITEGGSAYSFGPSLSSDGSTVAFESEAINLVEGETDENGATPDVFVYDVATGQTTNATQGGNGRSYSPSLSADGTTVAFQSSATNLVEGETDENGNVEDVFVFDLATGERINVSRELSGGGYDPSLSADGSRVVFQAAADVPGAIPNVLLHDLVKGETINVTAGANGGSFDATLSLDGSTVTFRSAATNLVEGEVDANGEVVDVFVYDVTTGQTINVTQGADDFSYAPSLAADGTTGVFESWATNLVEGETDANGSTGDIFVFDLT